MKKIYTIFVCICLLAGFVACEKDKDFVLTKLMVQNETITPSYGSATIDCSFKADATISEAFVQYSLSSSFAKYDVAKMTEEKGKYAAQLLDLQDNTTYYIRYAVSNKYSSVVTEEVIEFQTLQCTVPTVVLDSIADVWDNRAKAYLHLTLDGGASVTDMGICWSKQANPTIEDIYKSTKDTVAVLDMTDLQENTQYYVRAYAMNKVGVAYSDEQLFTTYALPKVRTEEVVNIQVNSALLSATLLFDGNDTAIIKGFCWGDKAEPTIDANHIAVDTISAHYTYVLSELLPATEYHVRAYAQNKIGVVYGEEKTFTTTKDVVSPTVTTATVTQITETSAVAGGNVTSDGGAEITERGVVYATTQNPTTNNIKVKSGTGTGSFTCNLTGLQQNTTYYVRAYAINEKGTGYGEEVSFTTNKQIVLPSVITAAVTQITETSAVTGGNVTSDGGANVTERGVVYATTQNPTTADNKLSNGSGTGSFTCNLTGLQPNTTYYVRAYAINSKGTAYDEEVTFTTNKQIVLPSVTTATVTQITETTAVAGGNVTSDGGASVTERGVVYAMTQNPTTNNIKVKSGTGTGSFTCNLTGLQANTTYYVRAYATNEVGTAYGEEVSFTTQEQSSTPNNGTENGYAYVDLGLSVKWATMNVGASNPEDYGGYFAWGETSTKSTYDWSTYKHFNGSSTPLTKYNTSSSYGTVDNKTTLELSDDAAHVNWGGAWRMPTDAELTELRKQCTWTWTSQNGVNGYKVTSKSNGNSIFLPAAGYRHYSSLGDAGSYGNYWSSSLYTDHPYYAWGVYFYSGSVGRDYYYRGFGFTVRPVCGEYVMEETVPTIITTTVTQITETTAVAGGNVTSDGGASVTERGVVYSTNTNPVITNLSNTIRPCGSGIGAFTYNMTGLQSGTTYYVRAYAKNDAGTAYGEEVTFTTKANVNNSDPTGTENGHEYVDLGLSVKWATCNVGASSPEEYGDYFAWGEVKSKIDYTENNYKYQGYTKYNPTDKKKVLDIIDDAARINWGGEWRMPSDSEWGELISQCTWEWDNEKNGYVVTSQKEGYTQKSIFLPAAGYKGHADLSCSSTVGHYWKTSLGGSISSYNSGEAYANCICFSWSNTPWGHTENRYSGLSIRPVCP